MDEIKYLVFESHLLSLFTQCRSCHQHCTGRITHHMGSFICIKQICSHCGHTWKWMNQPLVKDTPAGNLLLSAAILFSGSTPSKVLHMLSHLNMASIKERTFLTIKESTLSLQCYLFGLTHRLNSEMSVCPKDHLQLVVMVEQIAPGILPNMGAIES